MASLFTRPKTPKAKKEPDLAAELRQRLAGRGGEESTLLSGGRGVAGQASVFKRNLGGTNRVRSI